MWFMHSFFLVTIIISSIHDNFFFFLNIIQKVEGTEEVDRNRLNDLLNSGRNGMIKFYQPWCGHCTRMKPDWDMLSEYYEQQQQQQQPNNNNVPFVVDVNCQKESNLCSDYHTGGSYPTILVFFNYNNRNRDDNDNDNGSSSSSTTTTTVTAAAKTSKLELYEHGRGYEDMRKFVDTNLVKSCDITTTISSFLLLLEDNNNKKNDDDDFETTTTTTTNTSYCNEKELKYAHKWHKKRKSIDIQKEISRLESMTSSSSSASSSSNDNIISMTYEQIKWNNDRINILKQLLVIFQQQDNDNDNNNNNEL